MDLCGVTFHWIGQIAQMKCIFRPNVNFLSLKYVIINLFSFTPLPKMSSQIVYTVHLFKWIHYTHSYSYQIFIYRMANIYNIYSMKYHIIFKLVYNSSVHRFLLNKLFSRNWRYIYYNVCMQYAFLVLVRKGKKFSHKAYPVN